MFTLFVDKSKLFLSGFMTSNNRIFRKSGEAGATSKCAFTHAHKRWSEDVTDEYLIAVILRIGQKHVCGGAKPEDISGSEHVLAREHSCIH